MRVTRLATAAAVLLTAAAGAAALTADPQEIVFTRLEQEHAVVVRGDDGAAVEPGSVKGYRFLVDKHDYHHMIDVSVRDGKLLVRPAALEAGSYRLVVDTGAGQVVVNVLAPLNDLPNSLENRAAALGITVDQLKERLGLTTSAHRATVDFELPAVYFEGQSVTLSMPKVDGRSYEWAMNGETIAQGPDANEVTYVFKKPGPHVLTYVEKSDGSIVASDTAATTVATVPAVLLSFPVRSDATLPAPAGFDKYTWKLDGAEVATGPILRHRFNQRGQHTLELLAENPQGRPAGEYFRVVYRITVE